MLGRAKAYKSAEDKPRRLDAAPIVVDFKPVSVCFFLATSCEAPFQPAQKARNSSSTWVRLGAIMEKVIVQFANALGTVAAMILGIWLLPFDMQPKCDSAEAVATLKDMALQKINEYGGDSLLRATDYYKKKIVGNTYPENLTVDSIRKRGEVGKTGSSCTAQIGIHIAGENGLAAEVSAEYAIEPTPDGKAMVTARFKPN